MTKNSSGISDVFLFLKDKSRGNSVEEHYDASILNDSIIVKNSDGYRVFSSLDELQTFIIDNLPIKTDYYEVALSTQKQKLRFDIDATFGDILALYNYRENIFKLNIYSIVSRFEKDCYFEIAKGFKKVFLEDHPKTMVSPPLGIDVFSSHSPVLMSKYEISNDEITADLEKEKVSLHVVYNCFADHMTIKNIGHRIIDSINENLRPVFDKSVYKSTQNFRLLGSSKNNAYRYKINITNNIFNPNSERVLIGDITKNENDLDILKNQIVTYFKSSILTNIVSGLSVDYVNYRSSDYLRDDNDELVKDVIRTTPEKYVANVSRVSSNLNSCNIDKKHLVQINKILTEKGLSYSGDGRVRRLFASHCNICNKTHDNDNGYLIQKETQFTYEYLLGCFRSTQYSNDKKLENIFTVNKDNILSTLIADIDVYYKDNNCKNVEFKEINKKYLDKSMYSDNITDSIVCIKSGTGSGKSFTLKEFIGSLDTDSFIDYSNKSRILILTYRRSLATEYYKKYADLGFDLYSNISGKITSTRLIIQVESLHRLDLAVASSYDYIVLDECNKTVEQLNSRFIKNINLTKNVVRNLMKSKKLLLIDAFLNYNTVLSILSIRYGNTANIYDINKLLENNNEKCTIINNVYRHKKDRKYYNIKNKSEFIKNLLFSIANGKKVAIPCNSKKFAETLYHLITRIFKNNPDDNSYNLTIGLYTGDSNSELKNKLNDINSEWKKDVVIYTSVVEAGNSFDIEWFDEVHCYFTNQSVNYLGCLQIIDRIRKIKTNNIFFHIKERNYQAYTLNSIRENMRTLSYAIQNNILDSGLIFEINGNNIKYPYEDEFFELFIRNKAIDEYSIVEFRNSLYYYWRLTGAVVVEHFNGDINTTASETHKLITDLNINKAFAEIKALIKEECVEKIKELKLCNIELIDNSSIEHKLLVQKDKICSTYNIPENELTSEIIDKYGDDKSINSYKNYKALCDCLATGDGISNVVDDANSDTFSNQPTSKQSINEFKSNLLQKINLSEYTGLDKIYRKKYIFRLYTSLDIINIVSDNKLRDVILNNKPEKAENIKTSIVRQRIDKCLSLLDKVSTKLNIDQTLKKTQSQKTYRCKIKLVNSFLEEFNLRLNPSTTQCRSYRIEKVVKLNNPVVT